MNKKTYLIIKRIFDIFSSVIGIILTSPFWLFAAVGIKISSHGSVFFKAERIGKDNCFFHMYKFRSMHIAKNDTEKNESNFKADTNRIFKFGYIIRNLKIDELPQLINVLKGDMSVVGPRPAAKDQYETMRQGNCRICSQVRPGLTGTAALYDYIYGDTISDETEYQKNVLPTRLKLEEYYVRHRSFFYDLKLIWYTVLCILFKLVNKFPKKIYKELVSEIPDNNTLLTEKNYEYFKL